MKSGSPGITATDTLETASKLCGDTAYLERGQEHEHPAPGHDAAMVRQLPPGYALVLRGGLSPVIAHPPSAWHDLRYLLARIRSQAVAAGPRAPAQMERAVPRQTIAPVDRWRRRTARQQPPGPEDAIPAPVPQGRRPGTAPARRQRHQRQPARQAGATMATDRTSRSCPRTLWTR